MWAEEKMSEGEQEENVKATEEGNLETVLWINRAREKDCVRDEAVMQERRE